MGDASFASSNKAVFKDTTTALVTLQDTTVAGGSFMDAAQSELTAANWPGSNTPYAATFSTTIFRTRIGRESVGAGDNSTIAHLFVSEVAASASITPPVGGGVLASIAGRMDLGMPVPSAVRIQ